MPEPYFRVAPFGDPRDDREARFSVVFCIATALIDGTVTPRAFLAPARERPALRTLMRRIAVQPYPLA